MGYLKEKYTKEYYLGYETREDGSKQYLPYGAMGTLDFEEGKTPRHMIPLLTRVPFVGKRVLDIGFGRGEALRYAMMQGAKNLIGIDFSENAVTIAKEFLSKQKGVQPIFICGDALDFLPFLNTNSMDVIIMMDVIEHIPKEEAILVLRQVARILAPKGHLLINTPFYNVDEDIIAQQGIYIDPSVTDTIPETRGMHCNKFTEQRFLGTLTRCGFKKTNLHDVFVLTGNEEK